MNFKTTAIVPQIINNGIKRETLFTEIGALIPEGCSVYLKDPEVVISVFIFKSVCGMALIPKYHQNRRLNLHSVIKDTLSVG